MKIAMGMSRDRLETRALNDATTAIYEYLGK